MADDENTMQRALYQLYSCNLEIPIENSKVLAFTGKQPMRSIVLLKIKLYDKEVQFSGMLYLISRRRYK
jgi:hypothetical protein